jgi:hypothetical protein
VKQPGAFAVSNAMTALQQAKERLLALDPSIIDDEKLLLDSIESEAEGDPFAVIDRLVAIALEAEDMAELANVRATELAERKARFTRRNERLRGVVLDMLEALGVSRLERVQYTASIGNAPAKVLVAEDAALPDEYVRITRAPNKTAIGDALKAGTVIEGAVMSNPGPRLTLKTR